MSRDKKIKWEPALLAKPADGIKSSSYSNSKPFIPSYEKGEERPQMGLLLSMEYARIWKREREELAKPRVKEEKGLPKSYKKNKENQTGKVQQQQPKPQSKKLEKSKSKVR